MCNSTQNVYETLFTCLYSYPHGRVVKMLVCRTFAFVAPKQNRTAFSQNSPQMQVTKNCSSLLPRLLDSTATCEGRSRDQTGRFTFFAEQMWLFYCHSVACISMRCATFTTEATHCSVLPSRGQLHLSRWANYQLIHETYRSQSGHTGQCSDIANEVWWGKSSIMAKISW